MQTVYQVCGYSCYIEDTFISLLLLLKVCFTYLFSICFVSGVLPSALVLFAQKEMLLASNSALIYAVFNKECAIALSKVLATQMGVMKHSIKVSSFEMHKFDPFLPHTSHSGLILQELMHSYVLGCL